MPLYSPYLRIKGQALSRACDLAIMMRPLNAASGGDTGLPAGEPSAARTSSVRGLAARQ